MDAHLMKHAAGCPRVPRRLAIVVGTAGCLLASGCGSAAVTDKAGGNVVVLRLATIDELNPNGQTVAPGAFLDAVKAVSGGRLRVTVQPHYDNGAVTAETDLVKAIAAGELDGGWPATRAFSRAGMRGLEPIEAPMVLTSVAAERSLVTGLAARTLLDTLHGTGVVGLGLTVGPLRRAWSTTGPLLDVSDWAGVTVRSYNSPIQDRTIRALGAVPVPASYDFPDLVQAGTLHAVETDVAQYAHNGYGTLLPRVAGNEVLWPRMAVLALSQKRYDSLTSVQQGWVRTAARTAVKASVDFRYDESSPARQLCEQGVHFVDATPEQLARMHRAVQPVIDAMAMDLATSPSLDVVRKVASGAPGPEALDIPTACRAG